MLMRDAMRIIDGVVRSGGYMVSFEHKNDGILRGDYFPDKHNGEPLIATEDEAWELAGKFAEKTIGKCVNIYVVGHDFKPVHGYKGRIIENRR